MRRGLFGLIPAHAGTTSTKERAITESAAHPRTHGENVSLEGPDNAVTGSFPHTRGKCLPTSWRTSGLRLIPAHAGKTVRCR